jgi:hypothetical protein
MSLFTNPPPLEYHAHVSQHWLTTTARSLCEHPEIIDRATFDQIQDADAAFKMDLVTDVMTPPAPPPLCTPSFPSFLRPAESLDCILGGTTNMHALSSQLDTTSFGSPRASHTHRLQIFGEFIGVTKADKYDTANPEFWCKNCPDDARKNCPFVPTDINNATPGVQVPIPAFVMGRVGIIPLLRHASSKRLQHHAKTP